METEKRTSSLDCRLAVWLAWIGLCAAACSSAPDRPDAAEADGQGAEPGLEDADAHQEPDVLPDDGDQEADRGADQGDDATVEDGDTLPCPPMEAQERYCINPLGDECDTMTSFCRNGEWVCTPGRVHPPPMPEFEDWAWHCEVYHCSTMAIPSEPGPDFQDDPLDPYVPPKPGSLTGEWRLFADINDLVPPGCERQPHQFGNGMAFAVSRQDPRIMYAGFSRDDASYFVHGVWKSVDEGETWFEARAGLWSEGCNFYPWCDFPTPAVERLYVDPEDDDRVFASTWEGGLYWSVDGGRHWALAALPGWCAHMGPVARSPTGVYHAACGGIRFESHDQGETWQEMGLLGDRFVGAWLFDPSRPERIWAGMSQTEYGSPGGGWVKLSEDGGATWRHLGAEIEARCRGRGYGRGISLCPANPELMAVAIQLCGLFLSADGGETWVRANLPREGDGYSPIWVGFAPSETGCVLYASWSSSPYGLYRSEDLGSSWQREGAPALQRLNFNPYQPQIITGMAGMFSHSAWAFEVWSRL